MARRSRQAQELLKIWREGPATIRTPPAGDGAPGNGIKIRREGAMFTVRAPEIRVLGR